VTLEPPSGARVAPAALVEGAVVAPRAVAITASMMRDMVLCEHRLALDLRGQPEARDPVGAFTTMLWEDGREFEAAALGDLAAAAIDLRGLPGPAREVLTANAMNGGDRLILGGRVRHGDLLGDPDLLRREGTVWWPGDVKSGDAFEDGRPKRAYAAQVSHYALILARSGLGDGHRAFILDRTGEERAYLLEEPAGPRSTSPRDAHFALLSRVRAIVGGASTRPALSAECKGCHWKTACRANLKAADDLTLIAELGRAARDALLPTVSTVSELAALDPVAISSPGGLNIRGVGPARLATFVERAQLLADPGGAAYARAPLPLAPAPREFFLDVEADPLAGDLIYLHGILERVRNKGPDVETFHAFFADDPELGERKAFAEAMALLRSAPAAPIYVYSSYERTSFRTLQARYPEVCRPEEIETLFHPSRTIDLLAIVRRMTEWPASDRSIKTLARMCGFEWRDSDPSGANSIEWFRSWRAKGDPAIRERIVRYNNDDVIATRVVLDALLVLPVRPLAYGHTASRDPAPAQHGSAKRRAVRLEHTPDRTSTLRDARSCL
jgi:predicted RecB family nuclease